MFKEMDQHGLCVYHVITMNQVDLNNNFGVSFYSIGCISFSEFNSGVNQ